MTDLPWWQTAAFYQVYPRSFQDSDGDGVGDLPGIRSRLDHLEDLGVDALWLSPVHPSPQADFGYDVSDYLGVDPLFGSLDDLGALVDDCHARGIRVILDGVFNHTSDQHPWFQASRSSRDDPRRDWYTWRDGRGRRPPNNWKSTFGGSAWTRDPATGQHYLHSFLPEQPDLDWRNPEVVEAVLGVVRTWLERGIDGFRLDVFNCYLKDPDLRDNPRRAHPAGLAYGYLGQHHLHDRDHPDLLDALAALRRVADAHGAVLVGETLDERFRYQRAGGYVGAGRLHLAFHFALLHSRFAARPLGRAIRAWTGSLPPDGWPTWVLSNHDFPRHPTRWGGGDDRARAAAVLSLCLPGTPFLYYGEELGMVQGRLSRDEIRDPPGKRFWPLFKGRDGARTPMQWSDAPAAGFTEGAPWLPVNPDFRERNVEAQRHDPGSVLSTYRALLRLRRQRPALREGSLVLPDRDDRRVLTWRRQAPGEAVRVVLNTTGRRVRWPLPGDEDVVDLLHTTAGEGDAGPVLDLRPHEALVLEVR